MDKALKQRLVGATVLIALAVVVLPMLLGGRPSDQQESRAIEVPPKPAELSFETRRFPVAGQDAAQPSVVNDPVPITEQEVEQRDTATTDAPDDTAQEAQAQAEPVVASQPPPSQPPRQERPAPEPEPQVQRSGRYLVQVGSFSTTANANALSDRLQADGLPVVMDTVESEVGRLHRVRVGPYQTVAEAEAASTTIQSRTPDVSPRLIDLNPDEPAPVTQPSDPLVRWVVQAGSFSSQDNATVLVSRLREAGFAAYSVIETSAGVSSYKVRIGPEINREDAVATAARLKSSQNLEGIVRSVD